jgi:hypothetical protein
MSYTRNDKWYYTRNSDNVKDKLKIF